ncbi:protein tyrosine phosphatase [Frankia sp. CN7]|uniref:arsenate reductase/protein-tyrosine-phosphatase family protein n=1 Tax=Frankia nepalensis TaxID=1836974 RepID=UPI0019335847|nr:protein tyrosine phosphatase [Frankia nepalensis]MBL7499599.1 protein tyrosine phosphatase [Frankia nepalensis]
MTITASARPWSVLVVCTGNVCRSPMAERMAAAVLRSAGFAVPDVALVGSAGISAWVDEPMQPEAEAALAARGVDAAGFRARRLTEDLVTSADLVLCASREHRAAVVTAVPVALRRACTLRELARAAELGPLAPPAAATDPARALRAAGCALAARALAARTGGDAPIAAADDDVADPLGRGRAAFETCADAIADALTLALRLICATAAVALSGPPPTAADVLGMSR